MTLLCFLSSTEYVQLYVDFLLNKSIYKQFAAFYHGFHSVCASDALMVSPRLSQETLQSLIYMKQPKPPELNNSFIAKQK